MGDNLLSWSAKRQHTVSLSSAEAEYWGVANVVSETAWVRNLLRELHYPLMTATLVYCDNFADIFIKGLPSALFEDFRFSLSVRPPLARTYADIFTKGLPTALFEDFRSSLSVRLPPAQTTGAY
nr:hypothetical protein [Tanacetum cinerariifolium]